MHSSMVYVGLLLTMQKYTQGVKEKSLFDG